MDQTFRFGRFRVSTERRELWVANRRAPIGGRAFDVLLTLLRRPGELVTKEDLVKAVWAGAAVEDNAIAAQISALRRALGDGAADTRYVATVPGRGYRFVGAITPTSPDKSPEGMPMRWRRPPTWVAALVAIAVVSGAGVWAFHGLAPSTPAAPDTRIAVLPFDALGPGQDLRDFADGLPDEILDGLSKNQLQAVPRSETAALRGPNATQAVNRIGAGLILEGSVQRDGQFIRVHVHLDDARDQLTLWSDDFQGEAARGAELQSQVAARIVGVLAGSRNAFRPVNGVSDPVTLAHYIRSSDIKASGVSYDPRRLFEIIENLRYVTSHAPEFAQGHADLATVDAKASHTVPAAQAVALQREAAEEIARTRALDPRSIYPDLDRALLLPTNDWIGRERLFRRALSLDPNSADANGYLSLLLADTGRLAEAKVSAQTASGGDLVYDWGPVTDRLLCEAGSPEPATSTLAEMHKTWPMSLEVWGSLFECLLWAGRMEEARAMLHDAASLPPIEAPFVKAGDVIVAAQKTGAPADLAKARRLILDQAAEGRTGLPSWIQPLVELGFLDDAFALAAKYDGGWEGFGFLFAPNTAPLRRDPRFIKLAARVGLVSYWRASGHWPDFCIEPGLPYDCRVEAGRAAPDARR